MQPHEKVANIIASTDRLLDLDYRRLAGNFGEDRFHHPLGAVALHRMRSINPDLTSGHPHSLNMPLTLFDSYIH